jgi:hypothetical protein
MYRFGLDVFWWGRVGSRKGVTTPRDPKAKPVRWGRGWSHPFRGDPATPPIGELTTSEKKRNVVTPPGRGAA